MLNGKKIVVVMPAYNAEFTLEQTFQEIPHDIVDAVVLVDDASSDRTTEIAARIGIEHVIRHEKNSGYGANQKTCYRKALDLGADVVIMLHPDYQYTPKLCTAMASMISSGIYDCVLGSRILGKTALQGGMPRYKYYANRILTLFQNVFVGIKLTEYHSGFRGFSRSLLESLPLDSNSDDFIFDNQMLLQIAFARLPIGEISCPTRYLDQSSSINFSRSVVYGLGVIGATFQYVLARTGAYCAPPFRSTNTEQSSEVADSF